METYTFSVFPETLKKPRNSDPGIDLGPNEPKIDDIVFNNVGVEISWPEQCTVAIFQHVYLPLLP
jgi:hypothetical protein